MSVELTKELLSDMLLAVQDLRRKYKGEPMVTKFAAKPDGFGSDACPLCQYVISTGASDWDCRPCHWAIIDEVDDGGDATPCAVGGYDVLPIPDRLARCDRWEQWLLAKLEVL